MSLKTWTAGDQLLASDLNSNVFLQTHLFGDGSDGDVTISVDTVLTRDMFYSNLTVNTTKKLSTAGYKIHVLNTLTNNGTIKNDGTAAVTYVNGVGGATGTLKGGANGGVGQIYHAYDTVSGGGGGGGGCVWIAARVISVEGTITANGGAGGNCSVAGGSDTVNTNGNNGGNVSPTLITAGTGGAGGNTNSYTGGLGGTIVTSMSNYSDIFTANAWFDFVLGGGLMGGAGGGGGALSSSGGEYAGGGGGQGGVVFIMYMSIVTTGTVTATGGAYGTGNSSNNGVAGSAGRVISVVIS